MVIVFESKASLERRGHLCKLCLCWCMGCTVFKFLNCTAHYSTTTGMWSETAVQWVATGSGNGGWCETEVYYKTRWVIRWIAKVQVVQTEHLRRKPVINLNVTLCTEHSH